MNKPLCIYHHNCADGFAAAWVVRKFFGEGNVDFFPGIYGAPVPDVCGDRDVVLVDFSYNYVQLAMMASVAHTILVLDHHKTAAEDLRGLPSTGGFWDPQGLRGRADFNGHHPIEVEFDMKRSGAMIAWDFFFRGKEPPALLRHIQDRDLWLFQLEGTREIQANVFSYPYDFAVWDTLMKTDVDFMRLEGRAIERKHHKDVAELLGVAKRRMKIGGHDVPVANLPYILSSDAGHLMAKGEPFAACYMDQPDGRVFSLRSAADGVDVSIIARGRRRRRLDHRPRLRRRRTRACRRLQDDDRLGGRRVMMHEIDPFTVHICVGLFCFALLGLWLWLIHKGPLKP